MTDQSEVPGEIGDIASTLASIDTKLDDLIGQLSRIDRLEGRSKTDRVVAIGAVCVAAAAVIAAVIGLRYGHDARVTADQLSAQANELIAQRDEARVASCVNDNVRAVGQRLAFHNGLATAGHPGPDGKLPPNEQAVIDAYDAAVAGSLPFRDCSPAAVAAYYANPPADPALNPTTTTAG